MERKRIDIVLTEKGLARSRAVAASLVREKGVLVDGVAIEKPSTLISLDAHIEVVKDVPFVGRGGFKLAHALKEFAIDPKGFVCIDIGSSTGGFTDCLLKQGVERVYAVDVGTEQLVPELRKDPRVIVMENTDIRTASIPEKADLVVIDVSFISLAYVLPVVPELLKQGGVVIALVKPQFEVGRAELGKNGIVKDEAVRRTAVTRVVKMGGELGFVCRDVIDSPIRGGSGNHEYLAFFEVVA